MEQIMNYIKPELVVVAVVLYFVGMALKKAQAVADKNIPLILGGCGARFGEHEKIFEKIPLNQSEYHPKMSRFMRGGFLFSTDEQGRPRA